MGDIIGIKIDDQKNCNIIDHNLIQIELRAQRNEKHNEKEQKIEEFWQVTNEEKLESFKKQVEEELKNKGRLNMDELEEVMKKAANKHLLKKKTQTKRKRKWVTVQLMTKIKGRRAVNRQMRWCKDDKTKQVLWGQYTKIKEEIKAEVRKGIAEEEREIATEMRNNKGNKVWEIIHKLNNKRQECKPTRIVNEEGRVLEEKEAKEEIISFWNGLGRAKQEENLVQITEEKGGSQKQNTWHEDPVFSHTEVKQAMMKLKGKKAAGPNKMKAEMMKVMMESELFVGHITEAMNEAREKNIPESWKNSKVLLLPKKKGHTLRVNEFRPITLMNVSYKIFSEMVNDRLTKFLRMNKSMSEEQAGFTAKRRLEENILGLQLEIAHARRKGKKVYCAMLDVEKAFDSVDRGALIGRLK